MRLRNEIGWETPSGVYIMVFIFIFLVKQYKIHLRSLLSQVVSFNGTMPGSFVFHPNPQSTLQSNVQVTGQMNAQTGSQPVLHSIKETWTQTVNPVCCLLFDYTLISLQLLLTTYHINRMRIPLFMPLYLFQRQCCFEVCFVLGSLMGL